MSRSRRQQRMRRGQQTMHDGNGSEAAARLTEQERAVGSTETQPIVIHQPELHGTADTETALPAYAPGGGGAGPRAAEGAAEPLDAEVPVVHEPAARELVAVPDVGPAGGAVVAAPDQPVPAAVPRAHSIDALRGLFLILMTLGFTIQVGMFPEWMYHRQQDAEVAGISWRDLAYAAFVFTMAAALPITLSRRIDRGALELGIVGAALRRGFLLFVFALMIGHSNTYFIGYTQTGRAIAVIGFLIMFALFTRRRSDWNETRFRLLNTTAWVAAIAFLALSPLLYDSTFSPARRDQVIAELAFVAVIGAVLWYFTRANVTARLAALAGAVALYLGAHSDGWIAGVWWSSPFPWLVQPSQLALLCVIVPGTIAGDHVLRWMRASQSDEPDVKGWSGGRIALLSALAFVLTPIVVIGLYHRWVLETTQLSAALCAAGLLLVHRATYPGEGMLKSLFTWAAVWLLLGLVLDPFEGGIRKVPETLSYLFTVTGLTTMLLVSMAGVVDLMKKPHWVRPLIDVGHNPMLTYILFTVFLNSIFELIPALRPVLRDSPGASILRSILTVVLVVLIVRAFTRARIYWRT
ncbi:MAG TPA: DUF5009 domain-containing protein [Longimicrobiales bacterium]|nr:DUF5009 domain-containing protein [Longimicrobiales bacterium]